MITSTAKSTLEYFVNQIGGTFYLKKSTNPNWKPEYLYTLHIGKSKWEEVSSVLDFLIEKRSQFELIPSFFKVSKEDKTHIIDQLHERRKSTQDKFSLSYACNWPYIAGYLDAEGSLSITRKELHTGRFSYSAHIRVSSTCCAILDYLSLHLDGCLTHLKSKKLNCKDVYQWEITNKKVDGVLPKIKPFLQNKLTQCKELIKFRKTFLNPVAPRSNNFDAFYSHVFPIRELSYFTLKSLNKRGV